MESQIAHKEWLSFDSCTGESLPDLGVMKISRSLGRRVVLFLCILEVNIKSGSQTRKNILEAK